MNVMTDGGLRPRVLAIAGGSCSGKTSLARLVHQRVGEENSLSLQLDRYYRDIPLKNGTQLDLPNFDHPDALDLRLFAEHLGALKRGESVELPIYDFATHRRQAETTAVTPKPLIIVEGHLILHEPLLRSVFDLSYFIECPEEIRLERRLERDRIERGRSEESVLQQFQRTVAPMHDRFVSPSKSHANRIVSQDEYRFSTHSLVDNIVQQLQGLAVLSA